MPTTASLFNQGKTLAMDAMRDRQMSKKKYNGTVTHLEKKDDPVDGIVRVAAATVGFFSEASKYRKAKKQMKQGQNVEEVRASEDTTAPINGRHDSHHQTRSATRTSVDYEYDTQRRQQPRRYEYTTADLNEAIWEQDEGNAMDRNARRPDHPPRYTTDPYDAHPSPGTDDRHNGTESYVVDTRGFAQNGLRRSSDEEVPPDDNPEKLGLWKRKKRERDLALHFLNRHPFDPATADPAPRNKLGLPVVIPQRRPEKRSRGFVRAYSPVLADAGIDEPTFLDFVDTFNKAIEPNPYLYAINLAGTVGLIAPDPFTLLVGVAATAAAEASIAMRSRYKSAAFLDRVNAEFFMPRGLVCMVATWKPEATGDAAVGSTVDFDGRTVGADGRVGFDGRGTATLSNPNHRLDNAGRLIDSQDRLVDENGRLLLDSSGNPLGRSPAKPSLAQRMNNMRPYLSSTTAMEKFTEQVKPSAAAFKWPEPAPLVFPSAAATAERERTKPNGKRKNALDRGEVWLDEFMDKRAQARYVQDNPTFTVASALPKPAFASRYADPNHPAASGDIVAFITGGKYSTKGKVDLAGKTGETPQDAHGEEGYQMQQRPGAQYDEDGYPVNHRYGTPGQQTQYDEDGYPVTHRYNNGQSSSSAGISHYDEDGYPVRQGSQYGQGGQYGQSSRTFSQRAQEEAAQGPYRTELPPPKEKKSGLSRLFQSDLLYLIIVNLPSEEEMAQFAPGGQNLQGKRAEGY